MNSYNISSIFPDICNFPFFMADENAIAATSAMSTLGASSLHDYKKDWPGGGPMTSTQNGGQMMTLSPPAGDGAGSAGTAPEATSSANDLTGDAEGVWSVDIDQAFQEALAIYPPCGRRKIIISDEGKMYGRNELIARYIKLRCGKTRTRKQVSSHIQVLARKKMRDDQAKKKDSSMPGPAVSPRMPTTTPAVTTSTPTPFPSQTTPLQAIKSEGTDFSQFMLKSNLWPFGATAGFPAQLPFLPGFVVPKAELAAEPRSIGSSNFSLLGFTAYVHNTVDGSRCELVNMENTLEEDTIPLSAFTDKYPPILMDLYEKSAEKDKFFLAKCWANLNFVEDIANCQYAVDSFYSSTQKVHLKVSTMACSFGKKAVEKIEAYPPSESSTGPYHFSLKNSPMCDYMVKFISELKKLDSIVVMNNVLENFTVMQVVTNSETDELLMVLCFVFEISTDDQSNCSVFRLKS